MKRKVLVLIFLLALALNACTNSSAPKPQTSAWDDAQWNTAVWQ